MKSKMKTILGLVLCASIVMAVVACDEMSIDTSESTQDASATDALSGDLILTGSTSVSDVANALGEAFTKKNENVTVSVGGSGSGEGPTAVREGVAQIGMLSRDLKDTEEPSSFDQYVIGFDGIAVIVGSSAGVDSLSKDEIAAIYKGEITNWSEVGGQDQSIQCIGRDAASGTRGAFEELLDIKEQAVYAEEQNSTGNVKQSVASNPYAIGYISLSAVDATVLAIKVDGVEPTVANIESGDYALQRPFLMITTAGSNDALAQAFMDFVFSDEGQTIVEDDGLVKNPSGR